MGREFGGEEGRREAPKGKEYYGGNMIGKGTLMKENKGGQKIHGRQEWGRESRRRRRAWAPVNRDMALTP